jgi:hypothetical protein
MTDIANEHERHGIAWRMGEWLMVQGSGSAVMVLPRISWRLGRTILGSRMAPAGQYLWRQQWLWH